MHTGGSDGYNRQYKEIVARLAVRPIKDRMADHQVACKGVGRIPGREDSDMTTLDLCLRWVAPYWGQISTYTCVYVDTCTCMYVYATYTCISIVCGHCT